MCRELSLGPFASHACMVSMTDDDEDGDDDDDDDNDDDGDDGDGGDDDYMHIICTYHLWSGHPGYL